MDYRLPIAIVLGVAYSVWLAWSALKDPTTSEKRLYSLARYALLWGIAILTLTIVANISHTPISDILSARLQSVRSQGGIAFAYAFIASSAVFWLASSRARS
ncbi:hypothetical protein [Pseudoxanthomonas mexicana]